MTHNNVRTSGGYTPREFGGACARAGGAALCEKSATARYSKLVLTLIRIRKCHARPARCRAPANRRQAADCNNFWMKTSPWFTIRRPKFCLKFEFELRQSLCSSPPVSSPQTTQFDLLTSLPRATSLCCTPSNTQKHLLHVCLLAHLIRLLRFS